MEKIFSRRKKIFFFQNCYNSGKNEDIDLCFFANILLLIPQKWFFNKNWVLEGVTEVTFHIFRLLNCFPGALMGATPPPKKKIEIKIDQKLSKKLRDVQQERKETSFCK